MSPQISSPLKLKKKMLVNIRAPIIMAKQKSSIFILLVRSKSHVKVYKYSKIKFQTKKTRNVSIQATSNRRTKSGWVKQKRLEQ